MDIVKKKKKNCSLNKRLSISTNKNNVFIYIISYIRGFLSFVDCEIQMYIIRSIIFPSKNSVCRLILKCYWNNWLVDQTENKKTTILIIDYSFQSFKKKKSKNDKISLVQAFQMWLFDAFLMSYDNKQKYFWSIKTTLLNM